MTTLATVLNGAATITTAAAPTLGNINSYNAAAGALAVPLPALAGMMAGAYCIVEKHAVDASSNTVTFTTNSGDTFDDSANTLVLQYSGEKRTLQVVSAGGTKYWKVTHVSPGTQWVTGSTTGQSKLVSIGDQGYGTTTVGMATSTAGTSEMMFTVGVAATTVTAQWEHWYTALSPSVDTDPSGPITFAASLKVVSSTNPGTVTGTLYRFTFNGRTSATLDPGGRITADVLGISVAPGDVVAVRTYLSSGTAYAPRQTQGGAAPGGFTTTTDLTAPGSAAISASYGAYYGPSVLLGQAQGAANAKSVLLVGDSIAAGLNDTVVFTIPALGQGGFVIRALSGVAGLVNVAVFGDMASLFQGTGGSVRRLSTAPLCNSAIIEYPTNDIGAGTLAAACEAINLNIANNLRRLGIGKVFLITVLPRTTSTDNWATTTNQTPLASESQRVAYNTWIRGGCPISPTTKAAVAVGTTGALLAGGFGHPVTAVFDTAATVESSLNSGKWLPANRVVTGSITSGSNVLTSSGANFLTATQESGGDLGSAVSLAGAGAAGAALITTAATVSSTTQILVTALASATVSSATLSIGLMTQDGVHPSGRGHYLISQAINTALL